MILTLFQKSLINDLSSGNITDEISFLEKYFNYHASGDKYNTFVFLDNAVKESISNSMLEFYKTIIMLEKNDLLLLLDKPIAEHKETKILIGDPPNEYRLYESYKTISNKLFLPTSELTEFINRKYLTRDEEAYYEEKRSRKIAQLVNIIVAVIALIGLTINIIFFNNERKVTIKNPLSSKDTINVKIRSIEKDTVFTK